MQRIRFVLLGVGVTCALFVESIAAGTSSRPAATGGAAGDWTVKVTDKAFIVGSFHGDWFRHGTLDAVFAGLGRPDTCTAKTERGYPTIKATWRKLDLAVTAGLNEPAGLRLAHGKTGCTQSIVMTDLYFTLTGNRWRTDRHLQLGDSVARLRSLYPTAARHGDHYWLHARVGATGLTGDLIANISDSKIVSFNVLAATSV